MIKPSFIVLILFSLFSIEAIGQSLNLRMVGKDSLENRVIDSISYKKKHANFKLLTEEVTHFKNLLYSIGYLESEFDALKKQTDSSFQIKINLKNKYKSLHIKYDANLVSKDVLELVSNQISDTYFTIPIEHAEKALQTINLKISEQGDPFSTLKLSKITVSNNKDIKATLTISNKNQTRQIDHIIMKGYEKFPKSYIKHYLKLKKGDRFNISEIKEKAKTLNELQFANQIKDPEILFSKDSTTIYLFTEKNKSNSFDGFLGFGTNEETSKLEFSGYLNLELHNNLNFGETFKLLYKSDENEQKTFHVNISLPYLFNSPLGTELELHLIKKDSSYSTVNQNAKLFYQFNARNKIYTGIKSIQSNSLLDSIYNNPLIQDYKTTFYNVRYQYIKRQKRSLLFNKSSFLNFELETGSREFEKQKTKQYQYYIDAFHIFNLNRKNSVFLRANSFGLFSDSYLENELILFGGINSIRGFKENSLSASLYGLINTEYRFLLNNSFYVHSIIDIAYFENKIIDQKEKLYSFGMGFGLTTKAGLLKFNFANGKTENQAFKFSNSQIHISLTAYF